MDSNNWEKMQIEALVCEREGMIATNKQREFEGKAMAYTMDQFIAIQQQLYALLQG